MKQMKKEEPKSKKHECFRVVIMCEKFLGEKLAEHCQKRRGSFLTIVRKLLLK